MITLYCIRRRGEPPPRDLCGTDGTPVRLLQEGELGAWVSDGRADADLISIQVHDRIVRAALRTATPVPARFGTVFSDEAAVRRSLRARAEVLLQALDQVDGRVEMGVRVLWELPDPPEAPTVSTGGRAYLETRRRAIAAEEELRRAANQLLDEVDGALSLERFATSRVVLLEAGVAGTLAHLVHRQAFVEYRAAVQRARSAFPSAELHMTGPWAPYSFV